MHKQKNPYLEPKRHFATNSDNLKDFQPVPHFIDFENMDSYRYLSELVIISKSFFIDKWKSGDISEEVCKDILDSIDRQYSLLFGLMAEYIDDECLEW